MSDKKARNKLRFFYPSEWYSFISVVKNKKHRFIFRMLMNTGLRIGEARNLRKKDFNLERNYLTVRKSKTGNQREVFYSTQFKIDWLEPYLEELQSEDKLGIPSTQFLDRVIKKYCRKAEIDNPEDFTLHTFRKTHENWLAVKGVNTMILTKQLGHDVNTAQVYYVSQFLKPEEKQQIKTLLGDLFDDIK